ncbi:Extracellular protein [Streptococcus mitis]|uniref:Extracellular protein n=1 Tax=Streptococcus mitis TaxID=28037 RepID=A0A150NFT6_STRMT|nr:Extracellular protein [Streptococcus mitis]
MTPDVYSKIMNVANDSSLQLYSSAKIQKLGDKSPLEVKIETPENITKVTQDMYRNAAVTLGVEHAKITVAAPIPVTGESALAGIYYSLEANGAKVPQANKELAQEELKALSDINAENKDKSGYDANKLNVALADIKSGLAKAKESKGNLTEEDVRKIVEDTLKNYKLDQVITGNQINIIINFALNLSKSDILSNADFTKTLNDLKQSIVSQAGDSFKNINLNFDADKALEEGGNFLSSIWQAIVNFFKSFGS